MPRPITISMMTWHAAPSVLLLVAAAITSTAPSRGAAPPTGALSCEDLGDDASTPRPVLANADGDLFKIGAHCSATFRIDPLPPPSPPIPHDSCYRCCRPVLDWVPAALYLHQLTNESTRFGRSVMEENRFSARAARVPVLLS